MVPIVSMVTPHTLFVEQVRALASQLPGVFDGDTNRIHDARVASRRIRELLPLTAEHPKRVEELYSRFKKIGRSLGEVRDADVRIALLSYLETRIPSAAPVLVTLRQRVGHERLRLMRKLIKRFERIGVARLLHELDADESSWRRFVLVRSRASWRPHLRHTLAQRSAMAAEAIAHATGVYFPHRTHAARIAIKRLRYAVEIEHATGTSDRSAALADLKKGQEHLGDLHDRQTLLEDIAEPGASDQLAAERAQQIAVVAQLVEAECARLHERYLARRGRLLEICGRNQQASHDRHGRQVPLTSLVTIGAVAVSGGYFARRRRLAAANDR